MTTRRTLLTVLVASFLALTTVGCGVEVSSDAGGASSDAQAVVPTTEGGETGGGAEPAEPTDAGPATSGPGDTSSLPPAGDAEQLKETIVAGFKSFGLSDAEANCLADAYLDEFGASAGATPEAREVFDLFAQCDIDPTSLGGGG